MTPQSGNQVSTSLGNSGLCWTVFTRNRDTAVPAEGNSDLQTLICVLVVRPRRCLALSNPVPWQNWMAAYLGYTVQMRTLFRRWPSSRMYVINHSLRLTYTNCESVFAHVVVIVVKQPITCCGHRLRSDLDIYCLGRCEGWQPLCVDAETLVEVPFCPHCESEMILEVPSQPAGKTLDSSASGKPPRTVNQST